MKKVKGIRILTKYESGNGEDTLLHVNTSEEKYKESLELNQKICDYVVNRLLKRKGRKSEGVVVNVVVEYVME